MNYHTPVTQDVKVDVPHFVKRKGELVCPKNVYLKAQYPNLPCDMVKVTGMNGQNVFIPLSKVSSMDA